MSLWRVLAVVPAGLALVLWATAGSAWAVTVTGYAAILGVAVSLGCGLLRRCLQWPLRRVRTLRRWSGMRAAELAVIHLAVIMGNYLQWEWAQLLAQGWLAAGTLATLILVMLWLTSWPRIITLLRLGPVWQLLHSSAHALPLLCAAHIMVAARSGPLGLRVIAACLVTWLLLRAVVAPGLTWWRQRQSSSVADRGRSRCAAYRQALSPFRVSVEVGGSEEQSIAS